MGYMTMEKHYLEDKPYSANLQGTFGRSLRFPVDLEIDQASGHRSTIWDDTAVNSKAVP